MALRIKANNRISNHKENAIKEVEADEMTTLTINIPKSMHSELKMAAVRHNSSMTDLMINLIKQYILK